MIRVTFDLEERYIFTPMRYQVFAGVVLMVLCWWRPALAGPTDEVAGAQATASPTLYEKGRHERDDLSFPEAASAETRQRFLAVREKALEDPKLQRLRKDAQRANSEFFRAMRRKMLEIDPGLADIVRKRSAYFKARRAWSETGGFASLSDDEREKLVNVLAQVYEDPAVEAADKKKWAAKSNAEWKAAEEAYRNALRDAMAKLDPSIVPILGKLDAPQSSSSTAAETPTEEKQK
jgi:hypothetical protein